MNEKPKKQILDPCIHCGETQLDDYMGKLDAMQYCLQCDYPCCLKCGANDWSYDGPEDGGWNGGITCDICPTERFKAYVDLLKSLVENCNPVPREIIADARYLLKYSKR